MTEIKGDDMPTPNTTTKRKTTPPLPTNGDGILPEHRQKRVEAGVAAYQQVEAERDDLARQLHAANVKIDGLNVQLESLKGIVDMMSASYKGAEQGLQDRVAKSQRERDEFADRALSLEATLANAYRILHDVVHGKVKNDPPPAA